MRTILVTIPFQLLSLAAIGFLIYLAVLLVKVLRKYLRGNEVRKEYADTCQNLAQRIKAERLRCQMTQEFVAERLGVSRQAVSKWESGKSDPSTTNLLALAKLFGIEPESLLREKPEE